MTFKALVGKRMRQQFLVGADDLLKPLTAAVQLVEAVDLRLHGALEAADGLPGMYMFQQALLLLRRELSAEDTLALWEKLFALQCLVKAETPGDKGPGPRRAAQPRGGAPPVHAGPHHRQGQGECRPC